MYCKNCGGQIDDHSSYCKHCGNALSKDTQEGMQGQGGNIPYQNVEMQNTMCGGNQQNMVGTMPYNGRGAIKKINIAAIAASVLLAAAMFLPYVSIESFVTVSKPLIDGDGVLFMIVAALGIIGALVKKNGIVILAGCLACLLSVVEIVVFAHYEYGEFYTRGVGFYMMIIMSVFLLISGFIKRR